MDVMRTEDGLVSGEAALLVFLPDAVRGRWVPAIELWVRERTGCVPVAREWVSFTEEALDRFYPGVAGRFPEGWPLFVQLLTTGPCLATLWLGAEASRVLPSVKGATHPAHCTASTIRGRFWCDNPTANLVHISDDGAAAVRELLVLRSSKPDLFRGPLSMRTPPAFLEWGPPAPVHSAILTLCALVSTHLSSRGSAYARLEVPESGEARETMASAEAWLGSVVEQASRAVRGSVDSYLKGTASPSQFMNALKEAVHVDPWEELILRAGVLSRAEWLQGRQAVTPVHSEKGSKAMLRDVIETDLPIFFAHQCEPAAHRMAGFRPREHDAFMEHWRTKVLGDPAARKRTIVVDGRVAGNIGSWDADGRRLVGYWVGREYWGRGVATSALSEFSSEEPTRPLYAYVAVQNVGSVRVLQKCGFRQLGGIELGPDGVEEYCFRLGAHP